MVTADRQRFAVNGVELATDLVGEGSPVLLCHGFPETARSWRAQLGPLAEQGFQAIAPDLRGYGDSSSPHDVEAYGVRQLTQDLASLLDALGHDRAVVVGHDWGAQLAWWFAQLHPERVRGLVTMSVPFTPRPSEPPLARLRRWADGAWFYLDYFQEPGVAEAEAEADPRSFLLAIYESASGDRTTTLLPGPHARGGARLLDVFPVPPVLPPWLVEDDLQAYVAAFQRSGFTGPLNWYRTMDANWEQVPELGERRVSAPTLFITGDRDPVALFTPSRHMAEWVPGLQGVLTLPGCGHWTQQERPAQVTDAVLGFLRGL